MQKYLVLNYLALTLCIAYVHAEEVTYDQTTHTLKIPSLVVGDTRYNDLIVQVGNVTFVSSSSASKANGPNAAPAICAIGTLTLAALDKIKIGMTLEQVNQMLGCQYGMRQLFQMQPTTKPAQEYTWRSGLSSITVSFSPTADAVAPPELSAEFKRGDFLN